MLATDISPAILGYAADAARAAGLANVETREMDGEALDLDDGSFDAVVSRVGLIYFPDRQRALREIHRVLRPGGRLSAIVYSTAGPQSVLLDPGHDHPPDRGPAGARARASRAVQPRRPGRARGRPTRRPGSRTSTCVPLDAPVRFATAADCVRFERESFGALHAMLAGVTPAERDQAWREIEAELRQFEGPDGFEGPCELLVGSARRGA